ncbi:hypothetical protein HDU91_005066 [Kappamyces sp. JEL0680]|nr:hypothetical protein HDU91_005066 [Kappamyces sp. JEL0680]
MMPSPAKGTVSDNVEELLKKLNASTPLESDPAEFTITSPLGFNDWSNEMLEANVLAMHQAIVDGKPSKTDGLFFSTELMDTLPFSSESEIETGKELTFEYLKTKVNSLPLGVDDNFVAPYVPCSPSVCLAAFKLASLSAHDVLIDLGMGDGIILKLALQTYNSRCVGVELDGVLFDHVTRTLEPYKDQLLLLHQDMFTVDLEELNPSVAVLYLLPEALGLLQPMLSTWLVKNEGRRLVTIGYAVPDWDPVQTTHAAIDMSAGFMGGSSAESQPIHLYNATCFRTV